MANKKYYAVFIGRKPGIYSEWFGVNGAEKQIYGFSGARYKGFTTLSEAKQAMRHFEQTNKIQPAKKIPEKKEIEIPLPISDEPPIQIFTDGGCINNPGPGGFGVVMIHEEKKKEYSGGYRHTTNNRMELMACIVGLKKLKEPSSVFLYSDSRYVVFGITKGWARRWQANNWMRNNVDHAENIDLWEQLLALCEKHRVKFHWVKGHAGHPENERCDALATKAARQKNLSVDSYYEAGKKSEFF